MIDVNYGRHSLVLCGGGIDSFVAAWDNQVTFRDERTILLYVDYGCKAHLREIEAIDRLCSAMNLHFGENSCSMYVISNFNLWSKYLRSPLTNDGIVINDSTRITAAPAWVPARNTVLMSVAIAVADSDNFARIVMGINRTAAVAYPDNDREWLDRYQRLVEYAVPSKRHIDLEGPVADLEKWQLIELGRKIGMPSQLLANSWSCYTGGKYQCGTCTSCEGRRDAFERSSCIDLTLYKEKSK